MNIGSIYVFLNSCLFFSDRYPIVELLGQLAALFNFFFEEYSYFFPTVAAPIYNPNSTQGFPFFPHPGQNLLFIEFFDDSHSDICQVISHCGFICISLMISDVEHISIFLLDICICPLERNV